MKKLFGVLMMLVAVEVNAAHWVKVFETNELTFYVHNPVVKVDGAKITVGTLANFNQAQDMASGKKYRSYKALETFNCSNKTVQTVGVSLFTEKMGKGLDIPAKTAPWGIKHVALDSAGEGLWNYLCDMQ